MGVLVLVLDFIYSITATAHISLIALLGGIYEPTSETVHYSIIIALFKYDEVAVY